MYQSLPDDTGSAGTIVSTGAGASVHADKRTAPKSATTAIYNSSIFHFQKEKCIFEIKIESF